MGTGRREVTLMKFVCWEGPRVGGEDSCGGWGRLWQLVAALVCVGVTAAGQLGWKDSS